MRVKARVRATARVATACVVLAALASSGCADGGRWSTEPGESWCGAVTSASFVRAGMPEGTTLRLELDAERLQTTPGRVWTTPLSSGERLVGAELRVLPEMLHDPLSTLSFGEGRVRNAMTIVDVASDDPRHPASQAWVVLSLLQTGEVEARLLRGSATSGGRALPSLFGVFRLERKKGDCGVR